MWTRLHYNHRSPLDLRVRSKQIWRENDCGRKTHTAVQRQTAVTACFKSEQLLLFVFALQDSLLPSSTGAMTAVQRQTVVTAYFSSKQLLLFVFVLLRGLTKANSSICLLFQQSITAAYLDLAVETDLSLYDWPISRALPKRDFTWPRLDWIILRDLCHPPGTNSTLIERNNKAGWNRLLKMRRFRRSTGTGLVLKMDARM